MNGWSRALFGKAGLGRLSKVGGGLTLLLTTYTCSTLTLITPLDTATPCHPAKASQRIQRWVFTSSWGGVWRPISYASLSYMLMGLAVCSPGLQLREQVKEEVMQRSHGELAHIFTVISLCYLEEQSRWTSARGRHTLLALQDKSDDEQCRIPDNK